MTIFDSKEMVQSGYRVAPSMIEAHRTLLLVDSDESYRQSVGKELQNRGLDVLYAVNSEDAVRVAEANPPDLALVEIRLPDANGLALIERLRSMEPDMRVVVATRFPSVATAVEAIKLGAIHYLTKPIDADEIVAAFDRVEGDPTVPADNPLKPVDEVEYDYLLRILAEHDDNISATARSLNMQRRTLQRKLARARAAAQPKATSN